MARGSELEALPLCVIMAPGVANQDLKYDIEKFKHETEPVKQKLKYICIVMLPFVYFALVCVLADPWAPHEAVSWVQISK